MEHRVRWTGTIPYEEGCRPQGGPSRHHAMKGSDKLKDLLGRVFADIGETVQGHKGERITGEKAGC